MVGIYLSELASKGSLRSWRCEWAAAFVVWLEPRHCICTKHWAQDQVVMGHVGHPTSAFADQSPCLCLFVPWPQMLLETQKVSRKPSVPACPPSLLHSSHQSWHLRWCVIAQYAFWHLIWAWPLFSLLDYREFNLVIHLCITDFRFFLSCLYSYKNVIVLQ